jgi:hypothetical protein
MPIWLHTTLSLSRVVETTMSDLRFFPVLDTGENNPFFFLDLRNLLVLVRQYLLYIAQPN